MKKIIHLSSAHPRYDTRVFIKQCSSLASAGFNTYLVVGDGKGDATVSGVQILDCGVKPSKRLKRFTQSAYRVYRKGLELDGDLYHLHDPELIPAGIMLKIRGKKVIFDAHEDFPKQLKTKPYLGRVSSTLLSWIAKYFEKFSCRSFDGIVAATPAVEENFKKFHINVQGIYNYPKVSEFNVNDNWQSKKREISFVGSLSLIRGIQQIVEAMHDLPDVHLNLVGEFNDENQRKSVTESKGWEKVNELGFLNRENLNHLLGSSVAGLVTYLNVPNHYEALPNKIFEYMSAGIPVICSNFPLWKTIVDEVDCGKYVDPEDSAQIGKAIKYFVDNPAEAQRMGINGRRAVEEIYNWDVEFLKLHDLYRRLLA